MGYNGPPPPPPHRPRMDRIVVGEECLYCGSRYSVGEALSCDSCGANEFAEIAKLVPAGIQVSPPPPKLDPLRSCKR